MELDAAEALERLRIVDDVLETSKAVIDEVELRGVLQMIAERAARAVKAEHTAVVLLDRATRELHYVETFGNLSHLLTGARMPLTESLASFVNPGAESVVIDDVDQDPRLPRQMLEDYGVRSLLVVPMRVRRRTIGVLIAANKRGGPFVPRDVRVLETIANHAAVAVAHAELHARNREAHAALEAEKMKIEAVLAQLGDGVVVCDAKGKIVMFNKAAETIIGMPADASEGRTLVDMHPASVQSEIAAVMKQLAESKPEDGRFLEQKVSLPNRKVLRINIRPVFLSNGTFVGSACVLTDVTAQVALDEAKNEFVSMVAHELRTPLTVLKGSLGLMLGGAVGKLDDGTRAMVSMAQNNCDRLARLVDDMLDIAKIESGHLRIEMDIVEVGERVHRAVEQMRQIADERGVTLVSDIREGLPVIIGDGDRIEQVVVNLLSNALKFTPTGTTVKVVAQRFRGYIRVRVSDQGPGIPADKLGKVFEKFYQLDIKPAHKENSSGLGLAISKAIVEQHGGRISVRSPKGKGTTFSFILPIPGEDALMPEEKP
jgi:PAS domain S-box-containing protein